MKQTSKRAIRNSGKYIPENYKFLLERGYEVDSVEDADMGWQVVLRKADLFLKILHTRGDDYLSFRTGAQPSDEWFDLENVVYAATGEKIPITYGSDLVKQLQQYLGRIETYFAEEYVKNPDDLRAVQEAARAASWAAYQEALSKVEPILEVEPVLTKEPKRIPLLYYPLLGVILLLLFGALTTLYAVLLDRLSAAFSPEADSFTLFMGIGAILLAIGTMFLLRKWTKIIK